MVYTLKRLAPVSEVSDEELSVRLGLRSRRGHGGFRGRGCRRDTRLLCRVQNGTKSKNVSFISVDLERHSRVGILTRGDVVFGFFFFSQKSK